LAQNNQVRIGFLATELPTPASLGAFRDGLKEHGYVEGHNLSIDVRWLHEPFEQNTGVADELVRTNVDVIVAWSSPATMAARRATSTIPIVMVGVGDPAATGLVANLARPGGNITGVSNQSFELAGKQVELLVEIVPGIRSVGVVRNPHNPVVTLELREAEAAIRALGLQVEVVDASAPEEFESAFAGLTTAGVSGVVLLADPSLIANRKRIAELAQKARLPTIFQRRENAEAGGLLSYGPNLNDDFRRAASYVERILKGTKPAELPVEQSAKFEIIVNLKTAKSLGLTIPPIILFRADEVIE
jgi:putative ABC transport system substrate-binding protein